MALTVTVCLWSAEAPAMQDDTAASTRGAFLTMIERSRVALAPEVRPQAEPDDLVLERITIAADADDRIPMLLLRSNRFTGRRPAVIVLHGTGGNKEGQLAWLRALARRGFVGLAIDGRHHGERRRGTDYMDAIVAAYRTGRGHPFLYDTVWDVMRVVDYLATRHDVDPRRIGLTGFSKGGMETYLAAAIDGRIAAAVPIHGVQTFRWGLDHGAWDSRAWSIRQAVEGAAGSTPITAGFMRTLYDRVAPGLYGRFDAPAMLPLIAPRPLLVITGDSDPRTPLAGVRLAFQHAEQAFAQTGDRSKVRLFIEPDTGHEFTAAAQTEAVDWFVRWLTP